MTVPPFDHNNEPSLATDNPTPDQRSQRTPMSSGAEASVPGDSGETPPAAGGSGLPPAVRSVVQAIGSRDYLGVLIAIVVMVLIIGLAHPAFLRFSQLTDVLNQATFVAILACGMALLLAMRELDLSVGSTYALTSVVAAILIHNGANSWVSAGVGIAVGAALGLVNGLIVQLFRLPSIVATLATLSIFRGLAYAISNGTQVLGPSLKDSFSLFAGGHLLGIPNGVYVMIVLVAVITAVLYYTPFGYRIRSIGSNPDAAAFSGIPVVRVRLLAFVLMGTLGGLGGVLSLGYFGAGDPNLGLGYELLAVAAAVIGGTSLMGGKATIVGAALGSVLLAVVAAGLAYFSVPINWNSFATGAVILLAVILDSLLRRRRTNNTPRL